MRELYCLRHLQVPPVGQSGSSFRLVSQADRHAGGPGGRGSVYSGGQACLAVHTRLVAREFPTIRGSRGLEHLAMVAQVMVNAIQ
jgi:hypothetical protein